jgi:hypothetical protein
MEAGKLDCSRDTMPVRNIGQVLAVTSVNSRRTSRASFGGSGTDLRTELIECQPRKRADLPPVLSGLGFPVTKGPRRLGKRAPELCAATPIFGTVSRDEMSFPIVENENCKAAAKYLYSLYFVTSGPH